MYICDGKKYKLRPLNIVGSFGGGGVGVEVEHYHNWAFAHPSSSDYKPLRNILLILILQ